MNKEQFKSSIQPFADLYGANLTPEVSRLWFTSVCPYTYEEFVLAFSKYMSESQDRKFPQPGQVIAYIDKKEKPFFETDEGKNLLVEMGYNGENTTSRLRNRAVSSWINPA